MEKIIHSLIPFKEGFTTATAGAVALVVADGFTNSRYAKQAVVFGRRPARGIASQPISPVAYQPLRPKMTIFGGHNIGLARSYLHHIRDHGKPHLLEIHGRCNVATHIARHKPGMPLVLYLHNDPRHMQSSESPKQRRWLLKRMAGIFCVSDYVRRCLLEGNEHLPHSQKSKAQTIANAAARVWQTPPAKENLILVAGRMVPEKGMLEAAQALATTLPKYPTWRAVFIGSKGFKSAPPSDYEKAIARSLAPLGNQAEMLGFLPHATVRQWQGRAAIALVPARWAEPAGRVVIEALAAGSAVITTNRGGIGEYAQTRAHLIDKAEADTIATALRLLLDDDDLRVNLQKRAWADFPFTIANMVARLDAARSNILQRNRGRA